MKTLKKLLYVLALSLAALSSYAQGYNIIIDGQTHTLNNGAEISLWPSSEGQAVMEFTQNDGQVVVRQGKEIKFQGDIENYFQKMICGVTNSALSNSRPDDFGYATMMIQRDVMTADVKRDNSGYNWFSILYENNIKPEYAATYETWYYYQNCINYCNILINKLEAISNRTEMQEYYLALGYAYRAFAYLDAARTYEYLPCDATLPLGSLGHDITHLTLPIVTEPDPEQTAVHPEPRATRQEMYQFILSDLTKAEAGITKQQRTSKRLPNLAAVLGMKARLYMWVEDYQNAMQTASQVINLQENTPLSKAEILDVENGFVSFAPSSWIWGAQPTESQNQQRGGYASLLSWMCSFINGYANIVHPTIPASLYNKIGTNDPRKQLYWVTGNEPLSDKDKSSEYFQELIPYSSLKYRTADMDFSNMGEAAYPLMRIEEMYLIKAEAAAHISPEMGKSLLNSFVQTYRDAAYQCTATSKEDIVRDIFTQKRIELWGEGQIFFDYKRLNIPVDRTLAEDNWATEYAFQTTTRPAWMNMPISKSAFSKFPSMLGYENPSAIGLYTQNGGYTVGRNESEGYLVDGILPELLGLNELLTSHIVTLSCDNSGITVENPFQYLVDRNIGITAPDGKHQLLLQLKEDGTIAIPEQSTGLLYKGQPLSIKSTKDGEVSNGRITFPANSITLLFGNELEVVNSKGLFELRLTNAPDTSFKFYTRGSFYPSKYQWQLRENNGQREAYIKFYMENLDEVRVKLISQNDNDLLATVNGMIADANYGVTLDKDTAAWIPIPEELFNESYPNIAYVGIRNNVVVTTARRSITGYLNPKIYTGYVNNWDFITPSGEKKIKVQAAFHGHVQQAHMAVVKTIWTDQQILQAWKGGSLPSVYTIKMNKMPNVFQTAFLDYPKEEMFSYRIVAIGEMQDGTVQVLESGEESMEFTYPAYEMTLTSTCEKIDDTNYAVHVNYSYNHKPSKLECLILPDGNENLSVKEMKALSVASCQPNLDSENLSFTLNFQPQMKIAYQTILIAYDSEGYFLGKAVSSPFTPIVDYEVVAHGKYNSAFWYEEIFDRDIEYSSSKDLYRIPDAYEKGTHWYFKFDGTNCNFTDESGNSVSRFFSGYVHDSYGDLELRLVNSVEYDPTADGTEGRFTFPFDFSVSLGSFGSAYEYYDVTEWLKKPWETR